MENLSKEEILNEQEFILSVLKKEEKEIQILEELFQYKLDESFLGIKQNLIPQKENKKIEIENITDNNNNKKILSEKELNELINFNIETDFLFETKQDYNKKIKFVKQSEEEENEQIIFEPNLKILPHIEILSFNKVNKNDNFNINIKKYGRGLYIMKKWCMEDVKNIVNEFVLKNRYKILWLKLKNYCFSNILKEKNKENKTK